MDTMFAHYREYKAVELYDRLEQSSTTGDESAYRLEDELYAFGYNLFVSGKYENAKRVFSMITKLFHYEPHYWRALGATLQQLGDYHEAIEAYDMAISKDPYDAVSRVYRGECKILLGNAEYGLDDFREVSKLASAVPEHAAWVERAELLLRVHEG